MSDEKPAEQKRRVPDPDYRFENGQPFYRKASPDAPSRDEADFGTSTNKVLGLDDQEDGRRSG